MWSRSPPSGTEAWGAELSGWLSGQPAEKAAVHLIVVLVCVCVCVCMCVCVCVCACVCVYVNSIVIG